VPAADKRLASQWSYFSGTSVKTEKDLKMTSLVEAVINGGAS
jgi:hypothetical protein